MAALVPARLPGLRTDPEIAAALELQRRVRARRPLVVAVMAALVLTAVIASVSD